MVRVDEELSAELLERADRDQSVRMSLQPGHRMEDWDTGQCVIRPAWTSGGPRWAWNQRP